MQPTNWDGNTDIVNHLSVSDTDTVWHLGEGPSAAGTCNFKKWKKLPSRAAAGLYSTSVLYDHSYVGGS